jgi:hypothetical protein
VKIWNAVHSGEIVAYQNDSLVTEVSSSAIKEWSSQIISVKEIRQENGGIETIVITEPFDSLNGYKGARLSYDYVISEFGVEFIPRSFIPLHKPSTESGIELGINPIFYVNIKSLDMVLNPEEGKFHRALFKQRIMLGDLMNPFWYPKNDSKLFGQSITFKTVFEDHFWNDFGSKEDTAIGSHLFSLLQFAATNYQQDREIDIFFKDKELSEVYKYVPFDLSDTISVDVPNPDNPEDPYDIIWRDYTVNFQFDDITNVKIYRQNNDYTLGLVNTSSKKERIVYVKYSSLAQFLIANDRIVLEALLKELTK